MLQSEYDVAGVEKIEINFIPFLTFQNDTFKIVWSYSNADPPAWDDSVADASTDLMTIFPPADHSGSRSIHMFESHNPRDHLHVTNTALKWLVHSNSVLLPAKHTLYWCTMLRLPDLPGKHHMIGYHPKLSPGNERFVHHMMLYECHGGDGPDDSWQRYCVNYFKRYKHGTCVCTNYTRCQPNAYLFYLLLQV